MLCIGACILDIEGGGAGCGVRPDIEIGCKWRRTDVCARMWWKETADDWSRWEVPVWVCQSRNEECVCVVTPFSRNAAGIPVSDTAD